MERPLFDVHIHESKMEKLLNVCDVDFAAHRPIFQLSLEDNCGENELKVKCKICR